MPRGPAELGRHRFYASLQLRQLDDAAVEADGVLGRGEAALDLLAGVGRVKFGAVVPVHTEESGFMACPFGLMSNRAWFPASRAGRATVRRRGGVRATVWRTDH